MGRIASKFTRPIKNFNVENRARRTLDKQSDTPVSAPRYPSTVDLLNKFSNENPEYLDAQKKKHSQLVDNMQKLKLDSVEPPPKIKSIPNSLPEARQKHEEQEFGFLEPDTIPEGRASVRQVLQFLAEHQTAPKVYTAWHIARDYKLEEAKVQQVLKHFKTLQIRLPDEVLNKNPKLIDKLSVKDNKQLSGYSGASLLKPSQDDSKS